MADRMIAETFIVAVEFADSLIAERVLFRERAAIFDHTLRGAFPRPTSRVHD